MAYYTPASVPVRYLPVTGNEVIQGVPLNGTGYNVVIVNRRQRWWWQSGPVDSCCMCFPLEAGIVIMAGLEVARNCIFLLLLELAKALMDQLAKSLATKQQEYENSCTGDSPTIPEDDCQQLEQVIHNLQDTLSSEEDTPAVVKYVYEYLLYISFLVGLAGGMAGLWAVCGRNTLAAKLFLWSWLAGIAFSIAVSLTRTLAKSRHGTPVVPLSIAVHYFFLIYFTKVAWSYYAVLKERDINASSGNDDGVELRGIMDDQRSGAIA